MLPMHATTGTADTQALGGIHFLWLELTNRCNLACTHCYAESGPHPARADVLTTADFRRLLDEGAEIGCRAVQFIGGEPTLHRGLPELIAHARAGGYEHVEVYTNGTHLPPALLDCFVRHSVSVAVSVYGDDPDTHDRVTTRRGSHRRTIANLRKLVDAGLEVRAGVIAMETNRDRIDDTMAFVRGIGVPHVSLDQARGIGRGTDVTAGEAGLQALCGACWQGSLCVAPDGGASPCVMSKAWPVGSVLRESLAELARSAPLQDTRRLIRDRVWAPRDAARRATIHESDEPCLPCPPCAPQCEPLCPPCMPLCSPTCIPPCTPKTGVSFERSAAHARSNGSCTPDGCLPQQGPCPPRDDPCAVCVPAGPCPPTQPRPDPCSPPIPTCAPTVCSPV